MLTDLDLPIAERIAKLVRMLSSDRDGEVVAATNAIKRTLKEHDLDIHALAEMITGKHKPGPTPAEVQSAYRAGFKDGRLAAAGEVDEAADDEPLSWHSQAKFCLTLADRLQPYERDFVEQMVRLTGRGREPSTKQGRWLDILYNRLKHTKRGNDGNRRRRD